MEHVFGGVFGVSYFIATYYRYHPYLTCEVKCGTAAFDIADRYNAYSMALAFRGIVDLVSLAKREQDLRLEILAFSVSHDHRAVRIYAITLRSMGVNRNIVATRSRVQFHGGGQRRWIERGDGRHTNSPRISSTSGCQSALKDCVRLQVGDTTDDQTKVSSADEY